MKEKTELFRNTQLHSEVEERVPQRPLGGLSNYVVEQLPIDLEDVRSGEKDVTVFLAESRIDDGILQEALLDAERSDLAALDLKMLEGAIVYSGGIPPENLVSLVDMFSRNNGQPSVITYEEIILLNPINDPRTYTRGKVGKSEFDFYRGHQLIEGHLEEAIQATIRATEAITQEDGTEAKIEIEQGTAEVSNVAEYMDLFRSVFSKEDFAVFRPYLNSHPLRNLKGPSGAFTARFPELDLLVAGEQVLPEFDDYLTDNMQYFPRDGRRRLEIAREAKSGETLVGSLLKMDNADVLYKPIDGLLREISDFRAKHYGAVGRHIPDALKGEIKGTAGSDVKDFLSKRIQKTKDVYIRK